MIMPSQPVCNTVLYSHINKFSGLSECICSRATPYPDSYKELMELPTLDISIHCVNEDYVHEE